MYPPSVLGGNALRGGAGSEAGAEPAAVDGLSCNLAEVVEALEGSARVGPAAVTPSACAGMEALGSPRLDADGGRRAPADVSASLEECRRDIGLDTPPVCALPASSSDARIGAKTEPRRPADCGRCLGPSEVCGLLSELRNLAALPALLLILDVLTALAMPAMLVPPRCASPARAAAATF
mmetsp:Transcript_45605/g.75744  ORF Transcript_45605/g.75744 Transcript_45605/m.75744 type:complete len:180 (-) Transcript_45605:22-561(-)